MKRLLCVLLSLMLCLSLFSACGKSRADKLMDRYAEIANNYSALSATVASSGDSTAVSSFSTWGIELTDIASALASGGEEMTDNELDEIDAALSKIEEQLLAITTEE